MSYREENGQAVLTKEQTFRRAKVVCEIDELYDTWRKDTEKAQGSRVTPHQKVNYFRECFIESVWRKWPL